MIDVIQQTSAHLTKQKDPDMVRSWYAKTKKFANICGLLRLRI